MGETEIPAARPIARPGAADRRTRARATESAARLLASMLAPRAYATRAPTVVVQETRCAYGGGGRYDASTMCPFVALRVKRRAKWRRMIQVIQCVKVVPDAGIEPATYRLQGGCSTN